MFQEHCKDIATVQQNHFVAACRTAACCCRLTKQFCHLLFLHRFATFLDSGRATLNCICSKIHWILWNITFYLYIHSGTEFWACVGDFSRRNIVRNIVGIIHNLVVQNLPIPAISGLCDKWGNCHTKQHQKKFPEKIPTLYHSFRFFEKRFDEIFKGEEPKIKYKNNNKLN